MTESKHPDSLKSMNMDDLRDYARRIESENLRLRQRIRTIDPIAETSADPISGADGGSAETGRSPLKRPHFRTALRTTNITLANQDRELRYTWVYNPHFGNDPESMLGKCDRDILDNPEEARAIEALKTFVINSGQPARDVVLVHYTGQRRYLDIAIEPLFDVDDSVIGITLAITDITAHRLMQTAERDQRILAEALQDTALALNGTLQLSEVLDRILSNLGKVLAHDAADIMLVEGDIAYVVRSQGYGRYGLASTVSALRFPVKMTPTLRRISEEQSPVIIPDMHAESEWIRLPQENWLRSFVGVPIMIQDHLIGFLNLVSALPGHFSPVHLPRLQAFAAQAALAIHNARMHERALKLAADEERHRLARELHDSVNQMLFSSSVMAEALTRLDKSNYDRMDDYLQSLHRLNRGALAEMRMLLQEMRPEDLVDVDLPTQLTRLADAVRGREQIEVTLDLQSEAILLPHVRLAFYRIAQEAFNNISRHARAQNATVTLSAVDDRAVLRIVDDGQGFDLARFNGQEAGMGMNTMHERAAGIGGTLEITSAPGEGTEVRLEWPAR
ncbi:MAG: GAF domain-containing protein [Chloroflexota bacterium]